LKRAFLLKNSKTILITGAGSGIGKASAIKLAEKGHSVIATTETQKQSDSLTKEIEHSNLSINVFKLDVTDEYDRNKILAFDIDVLINNAAIGESGSLAEIDPGRIRRNFEVNVFAIIELSQLAIKSMLEKKSGTIIFVSSLAGRVTMPFLGSYSMTKFALSCAGEAMRKELKSLDRNVYVSLIEPGAYHTGFNQKIVSTKYDWMDEKSLFYEQIESLKKEEERQFRLVEVNSIDGIVSKIIRAAESRNPKLRYSAPWWQYLGVQIMRTFGK